MTICGYRKLTHDSTVAVVENTKLVFYRTRKIKYLPGASVVRLA